MVSLGWTKGGQRQGAAESVTVTSEQTVRWLWHWTHELERPRNLCPKPARWRQMLNDALKAVGLDSHDFRPYSLRRGGATYFFKRWGVLDRLLIYGRWQNAKTARTYINDELSVLASMHLKWNKTNAQFRQIFLNSCHRGLPSLEPARKTGSTGGGGRKSKKKSNKTCKVKKQ